MPTRKYINFASGYPKFAMNGPFSEDRKAAVARARGGLGLVHVVDVDPQKIGVLMGNDLGKSYRIWRFF